MIFSSLCFTAMVTLAWWLYPSAAAYISWQVRIYRSSPYSAKRTAPASKGCTVLAPYRPVLPMRFQSLSYWMMRMTSLLSSCSSLF